MQRTNATSHYEVRVADGETFGEKCRDSFGGWVNMVNRIEARVAGRRYDIEPVEVLR